MSSEFLFYTMLAFLFTHELDAVKRHEWRILPLIRILPESLGEQIFIWLHVPLFLAILWFGVSNPDLGFGLFLSGFSIVHVGLHWFFRNDPYNEFSTLGSWALILTAGVFGALHLVAVSV